MPGVSYTWKKFPENAAFCNGQNDPIIFEKRLQGLFFLKHNLVLISFSASARKMWLSYCCTSVEQNSFTFSASRC